MKKDHICKSIKTECVICMEDMHDSIDPAVFMRCGHSMHSKCFDKYIKT